MYKVRHQHVTVKILDICGIKCSRFSENDIMTNFNFGVHDIPWLQRVKTIRCKFGTFLQICNEIIHCVI